MTQEKLTVEYLRSGSLVLCYTDQEIQDFCDRAHEIGRVAALLEIPRQDAVRALSGLAPPDVLVAVSAACAQRASEYAYAAADAAAAADADAAAADAARAEYQITIRHYCSLMGWE